MAGQNTKKGYIYVLINPSKAGLVKIGKTTKDQNEMMKELSSATGVSTPFILVYHRPFDNCHAAEIQINKLLEDKRLFEISTPDAINIVQNIEIDEKVVNIPIDIDIELTEKDTPKPISNKKVVNKPKPPQVEQKNKVIESEPKIKKKMGRPAGVKCSVPYSNFPKSKRIIELLEEGKTISEIASMNFASYPHVQRVKIRWEAEKQGITKKYLVPEGMYHKKYKK